MSNTHDVLCVRRRRGGNDDPATASQLAQTGESSCIGLASSVKEEGFDIAFNIGRDGDDRLTTWPTGTGTVPARIVCVRAPPDFEQIDATSAIFRYTGRDHNPFSLKVSVAPDDPTKLHVQFTGRPNEGDDNSRSFGPLPFSVIMAVGPPAGEVYNRIGGTLYIATTGNGSNLDPPAYGPIPAMANGRDLDGGNGLGGAFCKA